MTRGRGTIYHEMVMPEKMRVAYLTPEVAPFAKSGELADVASALPKYLAEAGLEVSVFMPNYRRAEIESLDRETVASGLSVPLGERRIKTRVFRAELGKHRIHFIDHPPFFWREGVYGTGREEYLDNDERFIFFNRAVLEYLAARKEPIDILHCNNWATGLAPVFMKTHFRRSRVFRESASVLTLHNIAFQGAFPPDAMVHTGLNWRYLSPDHLALKGKLNFLKSGVVYADAISTVSSVYRRQILTRKHGFGLEEILGSRKSVLFTIRNGIDYEIWDPQKDPYIAGGFHAGDPTAKAECKADLIREVGLKLDAEAPLVGLHSYLSEAKGLDIVLEAVDGLMALGIGLVIQGRGDAELEKKLRRAARRHPSRLSVKLDRSPGLTHKLMAGADIILVPSRFEPGGLSQLYGFRYGSVPVVRATGGLRETVIPYDHRSRTGNGFVFREYSAAALERAVADAVRVYRKPQAWKRLMKSGFTADFSWEKAARHHLRLYRAARRIRLGKSEGG